MEYPELEIREYLDRLDRLAAQTKAAGWERDPLRRLHRLREFLFEEQGFRGNAEPYYDPRNSFLNDVLDRRLGIPITLSLVLIEVGRRLGLAIHGIGLPAHFIVGFQTQDGCVLLDPFSGGAMLTPEACQEVVSRALGRPVELQDQHFVPVTKRQFLVRMLNNLKAIYFQQEAWDKALGVVERLVLLDPENSCETRDRGVVLLKLGELRRAAQDWETYLGQRPEAPDAESVRSRLRRVRQALAALN
ncbi:MAG: tetratricopeptide repeat protein [Candidatus Rokubacteria bacterium]|nr:tetratricopeptide repeat protein [Candidatus Rokubacteria bacterium]